MVRLGHKAHQPSAGILHVENQPLTRKVHVQKWAEKREKTKLSEPSEKTKNSPESAQVLRASKLQEIARKQSFLRTHPSFHALPEDILKKFVDNAVSVIKDYKPAEVRGPVLTLSNLVLTLSNLVLISLVTSFVEWFSFESQRNDFKT